MALSRPSRMCTRSVSTWQPSRRAASANFTCPTAFTPPFSSFKVSGTVLKGDLLGMDKSLRIGDARVPRHAGRWRAPKANLMRPGVRVRPLRITDSCDLLLAPPKIVSMSEDQFTRAAEVLAEILADRAGNLKGIPLQRMS
jgi:hypothetical protein